MKNLLLLCVGLLLAGSVQESKAAVGPIGAVLGKLAVPVLCTFGSNFVTTVVGFGTLNWGLQNPKKGEKDSLWDTYAFFAGKKLYEYPADIAAPIGVCYLAGAASYAVSPYAYVALGVVSSVSRMMGGVFCGCKKLIGRSTHLPEIAKITCLQLAPAALWASLILARH